MGGRGRNKRRSKKRQTERTKILKGLGMTKNQKLASTSSHKGEFKFFDKT